MHGRNQLLSWKRCFVVFTLVLAIIFFLAYVDKIPREIKAIPYYDLIGHFILFGLLAFLLQRTLEQRKKRTSILFTGLLIGSFAILEEFAQSMSFYRTFALTDLVLKGLPGVSGPQASKIFGCNYFTGAHGIRYAWEAIFGLSTDVYFKNIQNVSQGFINSYQSQSQQSGGGFNIGNTSVNQVSQAVINYGNTPGADLSDPGFTSSLRAINEYNNNLGE